MPVIKQTSRIIVSKENFGWVKVKYNDVAGEKMVETNIRPKMWNAIQSEVNAGKKYKTVEGIFYHKWSTETTAGKLYSTRRQVEGIAKVASERGDMELLNEVREVLMKSDEAVARWYEQWLAKHTNEQLEEFYDYEPDDGSGIPKYLLERDF
jgi:hypothetical protein